MVSVNIFTNLNRLNIKNTIIVFIYLFKKALKFKPNLNERTVYAYYNYLIALNGTLFEEKQDCYITDFKNTFNKRIKLRKNPSSDFEIFNQVFLFKEYLPVVKAYNSNFNIKSDMTFNIIDAGSNIGLTTLFFLDYFQNASIICIEPEIENFKILEFNLDSLKNREVIKINGALWSSNCKIKIVNDFRNKSSASFRVQESNQKNDIAAYSISQLMADYNFEVLDILKIDIEGSEKQLFTHPTSNLEFLKLTKCIAIEIHDEFDCREEICNILLDFGFVLFPEGELTIGINQKLR